MSVDQNNRIVKLCIAGMTKQGEGKNEEASWLFKNAWDEAVTDQERFIAAHYVARQQNDIESKLEWDKRALDFALRINDAHVQTYYPSLYLNIAKGYEDLGNHEMATRNYEAASSFIEFLPEDGYGKMIKSGIRAGNGRLSRNKK